MRLSQRHERLIYVVGAMLLLSGIAWLLTHYFLVTAGEFGPERHPSEPWWLRVHGAFAMVFLIAFGSVLPGHVMRAWHLRKNRNSGIAMFAVVCLLVLTGYGLYYVGNELTRPWISAVHWVIGIGSAATLVLHVVLGKRRPAYLHPGHQQHAAPRLRREKHESA